MITELEIFLQIEDHECLRLLFLHSIDPQH